MNPIPQGYHTITPIISAKDPQKVLDFLKTAFGAKEESVFRTPEGKIMHAELQIGDSRLMVGDVMEGKSPTQSSLYLYVADPDSLYRKALQAGADSVTEP